MIQYLKKIKRLINTVFKIRELISRLLFSISGRRNENNKKIQELHNKYIGKRCFIICNGPSLSPKDLDKIESNGDISFASNKIDKIFPQTKWRPTFYVVTDNGAPYFLLDTMNIVPAIVKFFKKSSYSTTRKVQGNVVWLNTKDNRKYLDNPKFSENSGVVLYDIATVTYAMLQLAVHMGFRELFIIGCDNLYGIERKKDGTIVDHGTSSYFAGSDSNNVKIAVPTWEMNIAYEYARKYADTHGIKIYNATRGGHLEAFDRVDFDSLF